MNPLLFTVHFFLLLLEAVTGTCYHDHNLDEKWHQSRLRRGTIRFGRSPNIPIPEQPPATKSPPGWVEQASFKSWKNCAGGM